MKNILRKSISAIMLLTCIAALVSCGNFVIYGNIKYENSHLYTAASEGEISEGISAVEIEWVCGSIDIVTSEQSTVRFSEYNDSDDGKHMMHYFLDGKTLRIKCAESGIKAVNFPEKQLTVTLPKGLSLDSLEIETVSAPIKVDGVSISRLELETVSGNFEAVNSVIDRFEGESVSGNVALEGSVNYFDIETVSGDVKINSASCPRDVSVESTSGEVAFYLPDSSGFTMDFDSVSGSLGCELAFSKTGNKYVFGDGTSSFDVETVSGNVRIEKHN